MSESYDTTSSGFPGPSTEGNRVGLTLSSQEPTHTAPSNDPSGHIDGQPEAGQVVLILVGLVGSGKSTFAEALQRHCPQYIRCSQDELGKRPYVENLVRRSLHEGHSVCVDRTNLDATSSSQRSHWLSISHEFPGVVAWIIFFDTPYSVCVERIRNRRGHPTITNAQDGLRILSRFASSFEPPQPREGYQRLLTVTPAQHPHAEYSREDVISILQRTRDSPPVVFSEMPTQTPITHYLHGQAHTSFGRGQAGRGRVSTSGGFRGRGFGASGPSHGSWRSASSTYGRQPGHPPHSEGSYNRGGAHSPRGHWRGGRGGTSDGQSWRGSGLPRDPFASG
ncbi:AAA domain-containing protein [Amylostereum chailletii]|nr:AAA domain-containing protein [Amylostereum chailletii]